MKYHWLEQHGALQEGRESEFSESATLNLLSSAAPASAAGHSDAITNLPRRRILRSILDLIPREIAHELLVIPVAVEREAIIVAAASPDNIATADRLRFLTAKDVRLVGAPAHDIRATLARHYPLTEAESVDTTVGEFMVDSLSDSGDDLDLEICEDDAFEEITQPIPGQYPSRTRRRDVITGGTEFSRGYSESNHDRQGIGMFYYVVDDGQRVLMTDKHGSSQILHGPKRVWRGSNRFELMRPTIAHPGEFLIVRYRDGRQENISGPAEIWFDRRVHQTIERQEALQIAANEAIVVYTRDEPPAETAESTPKTARATRRVELGPQLFVPRPGEWLHTFQWHAAQGGSEGAPKVAKGLVFQKLWLMPDQMYHDVSDVRTADDAVLTIRLMIFFELADVMQMLDTTHDPIGDFVNAATADVVEFTGQYDFEDFKQRTNKLNELETYRHLMQRADNCGYKIKNVVYRGYGAPDSLQQMHDQAIEARTRLQLERATEEQAQQLEDFKLESQLARAVKRRNEQSGEIRHELQMNQERLALDIKQKEAQSELHRKQQSLLADQQLQERQRQNEIQEQHLLALRDLGVDLTQFLTQSRADQVIELRGEGSTPHVHVEKK